MSKPIRKPTSSAIAENYPALLADIKQRIRTAQVRTAMAGNTSMLLLYWEIGSELVKRLKREGWETKVLPRLAADLKNELPEEKGFSERNLKRMQRFAREYPDLFSKVPQAVAQLKRSAILNTNSRAHCQRNSKACCRASNKSRPNCPHPQSQSRTKKLAEKSVDECES